jgi:MerR family transcriptional regulator, heat shock protein HspR
MAYDSRPLYTIGTAAELLDVHPRTLRLYEQAGLLRPARRNNRRFYSNNDLNWIRCVRYLIHKKGLNQEGLRRLLAHMPCWEIRGCSPQDAANCPAKFDHSNPCWKLAESYCSKADKCLECEMYLSAKDHVVLEDALADIPDLEAAEAV